MESLSPQVVSVAKLPILNPNEFDLWNIRIEQVIEGVVQLVAPTTAEQRLAKKNDLKARGTLLMALPDKHQLKFNIHKDTKTFMEAIENWFVSVVASVSAASAKILVSALPSVDTLSNDVIYSFFASQSNSSQLDNDDLKQIDADDLKEMDLKWQMAMLTVECYNCHWKGHFARECRSPKDTRRNVPVEPQRRNVPVETSTSNALVLQSDGVGSYDWRFQAEEESTNYALMAFTFSSTSSFDNEPDISRSASPKYDSETVHTAFNVVLSPTKPDKDLSHRPSTPIIEDWVSDSEDDSEAELPQNAPSFVQPTKQVNTPRPSVKPVENSIPAANHKTAILKPKTHRNSKNRKACFVYKILTRSKLVPVTAVRPVTTVVSPNNVIRPRQAKTVGTKPHSPPRRTINHRQSPPASNFPQEDTTVKTPKVNVVKGVKGNWDKVVIDSGCSRYMIGNMSYLSYFEEINGRYVAFGGNPNGEKISGKDKIRAGKLEFDDVYFVKEVKFNLFSVSQMCDKKNIILFIDIKCIVLSPKFKLPAENQVLLRVPRENNMYNADLKNIVPSRDLTCLFAKATLDESNLWHRTLDHINSETIYM
nr:ribonuclease H-like domain-containing protein [Tanacetum cinerariifolium]